MTAKIIDQEYPYKFSVIMSVYNVAQFIEEALDNVVHQSIDFKTIQMILVDDGSTDGSGAICDRFKEKYPEQTTVIHKKNNGLSSARNAGLPFVKGKYVSFFDPDDLLDRNVFAKVFNFMEKHPETDICCIPLFFFGNMTGAHPLNYKFDAGTRVVDLSSYEDSECILLSGASSFFRNSVIKGVSFDTEIYTAEDAKVIIDLLMNNSHLGLLSNVKYHYRKHGNSIVDGHFTNKAWYTVYLKGFTQWAIDTARERFGYVPRFVQYTIMYDLQWKIKQANIPMGVMSSEECDEYKEKLLSLLANIDDDVILAQRNLRLPYKTYAICQKYKDLPEKEYAGIEAYADGIPVRDFLLRFGETKLPSLSEMRSCFEFISFCDKEHSVTIEGYHIIYNYYPREEIRPCFIINNHLVQCESIQRKNVDLSLGAEVACRIGFRVQVPLEGDKVSIRPAVLMNQNISLRKKIICAQFFPLTHIYKNMRAYSNGWMLHLAEGELMIEKQPLRFYRVQKEAALVLEIWRKNQLGGRKAVACRLAYHLVKPFKSQKLWIVSDRIMKADDNGEALFCYLMDHKPKNTRILFAISKTSPDSKRMAKIGPCVDAMSFRHKFLHLFCDVNISSQADGVTVNPYFGHSAALQDLLVHPKFVFLQHGITQNNLENWLNRFNKNISGFIAAANPEYKSLMNENYGYDANRVWLVGFPRFDRLYSKEQKAITIMPTWRRYLMCSLDPKTGVWKPVPNFEQSDYYLFYSGLLSSGRLLDAVEKAGYSLRFFPHPNVRLSGTEFLHDPRVEILTSDISYRDIYASSKLIVSDYSSAVFDFAYLRKPLIYCQFDKNTFFSGGHVCTQGYFDYERDGFGEVEYDLESTIDRIIEYVNNDCELKPMYRDRIDSFFAFRDQDNCKRVVEKILNLPENDF